MDRFVFIEQQIENGKIISSQASTASTAALRIAKHLSFPFPLLYAFIILPKSIRDFLYDTLAQNRYR